MPPPDEPRVRRTWPQRLLISFNAVALVAAATTAGVLAYSNDRLSGVERVDLSEVTEAEALAASDPQNYLIVGVDDASGLADDDPAKQRAAGDLAGQHTDTIMVVRVDPASTSAQLLSFPRDLWVPIADTDANARINTALPTGGAPRLIRTLDQDFGIPIHHYIQIDFADFRTLVEEVDGVPVQFPRPVRSWDPETRRPTVELDIPEAGCRTLGPAMALGFARERKGYQVQDVDGDWHTDGGGDLSRTARQQLFIELAMRRAIAKGARNPNTLRRLVDLGVATVRVDDALNGEDLVTLGTRFRSFDPADLETFSLPVVDDRIGGADVLRLLEEEAEPVLSIFRGVAPTDLGVSAEEVTVQVRNGTAVDGQAGEVTSALTALGFEALVPTGGDVGEPTKILYDTGGEVEAQLVARHLAGPVQYEQSSALDGADVAVVTGTDWVGVADAPRPPEEVAGPATTTAPPATTDLPEDGPTTVTGDVEAAGSDPDDPDGPLFYRAEAPPPGASCPPTP